MKQIVEKLCNYCRKLRFNGINFIVGNYKVLLLLCC